MDNNQFQPLWRLENQFWLSDADFYQRALAPGALMVLPQPAGILDRATTIESIRSAPRWQHVSFTQKHQALSDPGTAVLAYRVKAERGSGATLYAAHCSSTYVRDNGQWLLLLHQQTPAGGSENGRA